MKGLFVNSVASVTTMIYELCCFGRRDIYNGRLNRMKGLLVGCEIKSLGVGGGCEIKSMGARVKGVGSKRWGGVSEVQYIYQILENIHSIYSKQQVHRVSLVTENRKTYTWLQVNLRWCNTHKFVSNTHLLNT